MKRNIQLKQFSLSLFIFSLLMTLFTGCDGEKDLKIIDGNLPIKTSTLFMVGDATPNGWSIDDPTPFTQKADDPYALYLGGYSQCWRNETLSCSW